jgi:hypothetical protein
MIIYQIINYKVYIVDEKCCQVLEIKLFLMLKLTPYEYYSYLNLILTSCLNLNLNLDVLNLFFILIFQ